MELCHARPCRRRARFNSKQNQDGNGWNPSGHDSPVVLAEDIDDLRAEAQAPTGSGSS
jgi:hypothetical protein